MSQLKSNIFLVHRETGQRYPIKGEVLIGRTNGDIVFSRDTKLSQQHCKVSPGNGDSLVVTDLDSANGTLIDGKRLTPARNYVLKPGSELSMGAQAFGVDSVRLRRKRRRRPGKKRSDSFLSFVFSLFLVAACVGLGWAYWQTQKNAEDGDPLRISQREISDIFDRYASLQSSVDQQTAAPSEVSQRIQIQVVNRLTVLATRLNAFHPANENERQSVFLQQRYVTHLTNHARAEMHYLASADLASQEQLDRLDEQLEQVAEQYRGLFKNQRGPSSSNTLPAQIQPPLRLVEKEMRKALAAYRTLGNAVHSQQVSDEQMAKAIREDLVPKLNAVAAKLTVLKPETPAERQRLALELKLVPAFVGQLRAMASYAISHDAKYSAQMEHWSAEIEKLNQAIKSQIVRQPATK